MKMPATIHVSSLSERITRCCIIGTGILSGLEIALDEYHHICVTAGKAISSDGKYFELSKNQTFTFYRDFIPDTNYEFFYDKYGTLIPLWELVIDEDFITTDQPLSPQYKQERLNPFLKDKVLLVYFTKNKLTYYTEENEATEFVFNKIGKKRDDSAQHDVRFLLMRQKDLLKELDISRLTWQTIWNRQDDDKDYIYSDAYNPKDDEPLIQDINKVLNPAIRLPIIPLHRFGFTTDPTKCPPGGPDISNFPQITTLKDIYEGYRPAIDEALHHLHLALQTIYNYYKVLIDKFPAWDIKETIDVLLNKWEIFKSNITKDNARMEYIQYFYDWTRDLLAAYHELRNLLIDYSFKVLSDSASFKNHFLLGHTMRDTASHIPRPFRQHFKQPPVFNGQADQLQAIKLYYWRILVMIKSFYLPECVEDRKLSFCNTPIDDLDEVLVFDQLKVTPGKFYDSPLGEQSIPYYYCPVAQHKYSLHHFWNYKNTRNSSNDQILSYHAIDTEDSYSSQPHVIGSLLYNFDKYPFFRIEGFIGRPLNDIYYYKEEEDENGVIKPKRHFTPGIHSLLLYIKTKYNLPFNIKIKRIDELNTDPITFPKLDENVTDIILSSELYNTFIKSFIGMEHVGGVKKGGTFVIVYETEKHKLMNGDGVLTEKEEMIAVADFYLPFNTDDDDLIAPVITEGKTSLLYEDKPEKKTIEKNKLINETIKSKTKKASAITEKKSTEDDKTESEKAETINEKEISNEQKTQQILEKIETSNEKEIFNELKKHLLEQIGTATAKEKEDLTQIVNIGKKTETKLNEIGIYTFRQLGRITAAEYIIIEKMNIGLPDKTKILQWAEDANKALKK